jgi:hypothetical protein
LGAYHYAVVLGGGIKSPTAYFLFLPASLRFARHCPLSLRARGCSIINGSTHLSQVVINGRNQLP